MNKYWFFFLLVVLVTSCQPQAVEVTGTPTATIPPLKGDPIPVELSALAANPTIYENAYVRLTGQYTHRPRLVCESDPHPSPATWGLRSDTLLALAGGFDKQLRPLLPQGLTMTVAGRWRHWLGDVGCGTAVQPQDLWYLQVTEIITPSLLAQVTLTPGGGPITQVGETPSAGGTLDSQISPTQPADDGISTPPLSSTEPTEPGPGGTAVPNGTPGITMTPTQTDSRLSPTPTGRAGTTTATPGSTASATRTPGISGTTTPTTTPLPGTTATAGPTPTTGSLTTGTPSPVPVNKGQIDPEDPPIIDSLNANEMHLWTFNNEVANNALTIQIAPSAPVDVAVTVNDPSGVQIANQNSAGTGILEIVSGLNLSVEGTYEIIITNKAQSVGDYAIMILDDFSFFVSFHQINYGAMQTANFTVDEEQIWFFDGTANDIITITADPQSATADISFDLWGPNNELLDFAFAPDIGEVAELRDFTLSDSGLHAIWLLGEDNSTITVNLLVTKSN